MTLRTIGPRNSNDAARVRRPRLRPHKGIPCERHTSRIGTLCVVKIGLGQIVSIIGRLVLLCRVLRRLRLGSLAGSEPRFALRRPRQPFVRVIRPEPLRHAPSWRSLEQVVRRALFAWETASQAHLCGLHELAVLSRDAVATHFPSALIRGLPICSREELDSNFVPDSLPARRLSVAGHRTSSRPPTPSRTRPPALGGIARTGHSARHRPLVDKYDRSWLTH